MQFSIVNFSDVVRQADFRLDADYYREEILNRISVLESHHKAYLVNLVDFIIGPFGSTVTIDQYVDNSEYRYVRNKDINDFVIKDTAPALISCNVYNSLPKYHIKENDLLITVVGTLGKVAIATKKDTKSIFSCKSTIIRTKNINPFYLLTYLNTDTGKLLSIRGKRGAIQEGLNLPDLKNISIFIPSNNFQSLIEETIKQSFYNTKKSAQSYQQAQNILLAELELNDWQPQHRLSFIKDYADVVEAERFDAEYFQPKYDDIIKAIKTYKGGWDKLENLVTSKSSNFMPDDMSIYKYIELADITGNGEITGCTTDEGKNLPKRARRKISTGDVIVSSIEGSLSSIALIEKEYNNGLCSTGFHVIKSEHFNSETLLVFLKSFIGQLQLKKGCSGTILTAINQDEFSRIIFPNISQKKQRQIQEKVMESFNLRKQSKQLLENAKRAVEMAIEQDEKTALQWLEESNKDL